jgi:hypothetical protein
MVNRTYTRRPLSPIPEIPQSTDPKMRAFLNALKESLEVSLGRRGDPMSEVITKGELIGAGIASLLEPGGNQLTTTTITPNGARIIPPVPLGFFANGLLGGIHLTWEHPVEAYSVHAYTEVWRSPSNDPDARILLGSSRGSTYFDRIPDPAALSYWYWIRFVSEYDRYGPFSLLFRGDKPADLATILAELSGQINESALSASLNQRIDLTESGLVAEAVTRAQGIAAEAAIRGAAIVSEQQARIAADGVFASDLNAIVLSVDAASAAIVSEQQARATADGALAQSVAGLSTTVGANTASIQAQSTSIDGLSAQFTLRLDVNGYVSGFGAYNNGVTSDFAITADRFWIAAPAVNGVPGAKRHPFIVQDGNVYIDTLFVRDASIQEGQLGAITIGKITLADGITPVTTVAGLIRADAIDVENLNVDWATVTGAIQSSANGTNGQPRWVLSKNGGFQMNSAGAGGRMEVRDNVIKVFDANGVLRVQFGNLTA